MVVLSGREKQNHVYTKKSICSIQHNLKYLFFYITRIEMVACPVGQSTLRVTGTIFRKEIRDSKLAERVGEASITVKLNK